uniref:Protein kinase domain-containing protein n=1 Tax=Elaeophora elaphi TaxID=1147741 RepID=A0A158Q8Y4_9BILA
GQPLCGVPGGSKGEIKHRFEITKKLGSGTYGKVSLAYDHKTEREVALKLIKKSAIENKQDLVRIRREIRIMSALNHPNIIQIFEGFFFFVFEKIQMFENRDKIILVMEYASGGELYDYVSTYGSLPEPEARRIFRQITSAILYCHKHKVAHRDLKLENILLDANNNAKIADFGLSNYFSDKALLSTFCGSPLYASPEIINGTPYRGPEVDCWSLGILLYTLVYGSMPFDGRDFNRMVRQIKRGAYFEPDTPSTASMLIRNMLRVNPERRADIDEIASHWWLNLDENMPVIQELPENQIIDHTPLTDRAETMVVQDLADESDVFMDFGHLSPSTRLKIEEFRRRRKEAEEYIENSPIKPPKARKTDGTEWPTLTAAEKSLRYDPRLSKEKERERVSIEEPDTYYEPLERLKRLESRLQSKDNQTVITDNNKLSNILNPASANKEVRRFKQPSSVPVSGCNNNTSPMKAKHNRFSPEQPDDPITSNSKISSVSTISNSETSKPSFVPLDSESAIAATKPLRKPSAETWRLEMDSLNVLMNQVLEQMEKGPVSMTLVARIKAHPFYDSRPMVKELLESIIAAQPPSVQKQASKLIQQQSQELIKRQTAGAVAAAAAVTTGATGGGPIRITGKQGSKVYDGAPASPVKADEKRVTGKHQPTGASQRNGQTKTFGERKWHSVEVGFDPDEDTEHNAGTPQSFSHNDEVTEETLQDTSFEDVSDGENMLDNDQNQSKANSRNDEEALKEEDEECGDEEDEEVEESDSEIDELGKEVEQTPQASLKGILLGLLLDPNYQQKIEDEENGSYRAVISEENFRQLGENHPPPDPHMKIVAPQFVDPFDRGLAKRQSKGKYQVDYGITVVQIQKLFELQHSKVELYGRGVSTECESPTLPHRRIGGPQPTIERSPFLFDKASFLYLLHFTLSFLAKKYIMTYPKPIDDSGDDIPGRLGKKIVKNWLRTQDPDVMVSSGETPTDIAGRVCSVPPRSPPNVIKSDDEVSESESDENEDEEDENEESDEEESSEESEKACKQAGFTDMSGILEAEKRKSQAIDLETNTVANNIKYQMKSKAKEEYNKKDISLPTRKTSAPINLGNRSVVIPSYDAALSYLRRRNWDRRRRNRTIDVPENVSKSIADHRDEMIPGRYTTGHTVAATNETTGGSSWTRTSGTPPRSITTGLTAIDRTFYSIDPFYAHNKFLKESNGKDLATAGYPNAAAYGQNARFNDESFRRTAEQDTIPPTRHNVGLNHNLYTARDDKFKSKSAHDLSPDRPDFYAAPVNATKLAAPGSSNIGRYDNESTIPQSWALEPKRFYVYQTRAEREAEKNTAVSNLHPSSTYRITGSSWYSGTSTCNHPISSYTSDYKPRYDESYLYRRNNAYDIDTGTAHNTEITTPSIQNQANHEPGNAATHRYRPVSGRHIASVLGDPTRRVYGRSNSMERNALRQDDLDHYGFRNFVPTSEMTGGDKGEYSYVNFHDTATRGSTPHEPDHNKLPTRGILKIKQNMDNENRTSVETPSMGGVQGTGGGKDQTVATAGKVSKDEPSKAAKKRSLFLAIGRRRTTEMRLGPDGKLTIGGSVESDFKRPSSPIDKIKSLFRKSKESVTMPATSSNYANLDYANFPSTSARYGFTDKVYGVYPSSHLTPAITRDSYSPQYRKYTAAITTPGYNNTGNYNRYSYGTGTNDRPLRHWHEDPHLY